MHGSLSKLGFAVVPRMPTKGTNKSDQQKEKIYSIRLHWEEEEIKGCSGS